MQAERQRLHRFGSGIVAGHGYQREVSVGVVFDGQREARQRQRKRGGGAVAGGTLCLQHRIGRLDGFLARPRVAAHDHQQIGRRRLRVDRKIRVRQLRQVRGCGHQAGCLSDAAALAQLRAQLHQGHRVLVEIREDLEPRRGHDHAAAAVEGAGDHANSPANNPLTVSAPDVAPTASALCRAASTTSLSSSQSNTLRRRINGSA